MTTADYMLKSSQRASAITGPSLRGAAVGRCSPGVSGVSVARQGDGEMSVLAYLLASVLVFGIGSCHVLEPPGAKGRRVNACG